MSRDRVVLARIGAPHGVRGEVRVKSFAENPADVAAYGPLAAPDGRVFEITTIRPAAGKAPDMFVVRLKGVEGRSTVEALNGVELSVARTELPPAAAGEFYHADLIGLAAVTSAGVALGTVVAVANYGAGDLLEIKLAKGGALLAPFTRAVVPEIDVAGGRVVVATPPGLIDEDGGDAT